jgi:hypothetical protein
VTVTLKLHKCMYIFTLELSKVKPGIWAFVTALSVIIQLCCVSHVSQ